MGGRVDRRQAATGLLITAGCSCLFLLLTTGVLLGGPLERFDRSVAGALHAFTSESGDLTRLFRAVGVLGSLEALVVVGALVALALAVRRAWSTLALWLAAVLGGEALNLLLKALIARPRPSFDRPLVFETSYSYPSGQAMESLVVYGMLAYLALLTPWGSRRRAVLVCGAAALVALIGFSRAYLGAHYVSDVVGGIAAGGAWLGAVITARKAVRWGEA